MAGRSDVGAVETLADWCTAWRFVIEASAVRLFEVDVDLNALLADYDKDAVITVMLEFISRVLDSLGPARGAEVVQAWGMIVAGAEGAPS